MAKSMRQQVDTLLMQGDYDRLLDLCQEKKQVWKILCINLYVIDENLYWAAIRVITKLM